MSDGLKNKVAIVTGGSRGIGAAIVQQLAAEGANVVLTYASSAQAAEQQSLLEQQLQEVTVRTTAEWSYGQPSSRRSQAVHAVSTNEPSTLPSIRVFRRRSRIRCSTS